MGVIVPNVGGVVFMPSHLFTNFVQQKDRHASSKHNGDQINLKSNGQVQGFVGHM